MIKRCREQHSHTHARGRQPHKHREWNIFCMQRFIYLRAFKTQYNVCLFYTHSPIFPVSQCVTRYFCVVYGLRVHVMRCKRAMNEIFRQCRKHRQQQMPCHRFFGEETSEVPSLRSLGKHRPKMYRDTHIRYIPFGVCLSALCTIAIIEMIQDRRT